MRSPLIYLAILFCLTIAACGGGQANDNTTTAEVVNANPANNAGIVPYTPANGQNAANPTLIANGNQNVKVIDPKGVAKPMTYPAPNDSEFSTIMDNSGMPVETRMFRKDKYLTKVTRVWKSPTDKTISIYLKSGKVVNVPGDKWPDIRSQPVENFYDAAGIRTAAAEPVAPKNKQNPQNPND